MKFSNVILLSLLFPFFLACGEDDNGGTPAGELPRINASGTSRFEGDENSTLDVTVRLSKAIEQEASVKYQTVDGSAFAGEDYEAAEGTLTFAAGSTQEVISIQVLADTLREGDEEFELILSDPVNAVVLSAVSTVTLRNDDTFVPNDGEGYSTPLSYPGYDLVWQDEFDGNAINTDVWTHEIGTGSGGWGNNELQFYTDEEKNSFVANGNLVIEAHEESIGGQDYSSARMISEGAAEHQYGRIDIRAKLPKGQGIWPALWMLGSDFRQVSWPFCGEIDIMEIVGHEPDKLHGTIHWQAQNGYANFGGSTTLPEGDFSDKYHVFSIIWDDQKIDWLLDDQQYHTVDITPAHMTEFHKTFFFILNVAVGGNWPGSPDATTTFPQRMYVDYIRVFQED